jgi:hypothetical protein
MIHPLTTVMRSGDDTSLYSGLCHSGFLNKNENTTSTMAHTLVSQELEIEFSKTVSYELLSSEICNQEMKLELKTSNCQLNNETQKMGRLPPYLVLWYICTTS